MKPLPFIVRWRNAVCSRESALSSTERLVALALALYADANGAGASMSQKTLAVACGLSERSVGTTLASLRANSWCSGKRIRRRGDRTGWIALSWSATMPPCAADWNLPVAEVPEPVAETQAQVPATDGAKSPQLTTEVPEPVADYLERAPRKRNIEKSKSSRAHALDLPEWLPADAWADWCEYRRKKSNAAFTHKAKALSLRTLAKLQAAGVDPREAIDTAIERGWSGLFDPGASSAGTSIAARPSRESAADRVARINREAEARERIGSGRIIEGGLGHAA